MKRLARKSRVFRENDGSIRRRELLLMYILFMTIQRYIPFHFLDESPPPVKKLVKLLFIPFICSSLALSSSAAISANHFSPFSAISFSIISYCLWPLSRIWSHSILPCSSPSAVVWSRPSRDVPAGLIPNRDARSPILRFGLLARS